MRAIKHHPLTTEEMQKVADAMGVPVYRLVGGQCTNNPVGAAVVETVYPANTKTVANDHGLGENVSHEYATPKGDGRKL